MDALPKNDQDRQRGASRKRIAPNTSTKADEIPASSESASIATSQHSKQRQQEHADKSDKAYIASLRRSIRQMKNGNVQPVREGLEDLRRELDTDAKVNPVDR